MVRLMPVVHERIGRYALVSSYAADALPPPPGRRTPIRLRHMAVVKQHFPKPITAIRVSKNMRVLWRKRKVQPPTKKTMAVWWAAIEEGRKALRDAALKGGI